MKTRRFYPSAFSLVELLVVIAIIAILVGLGGMALGGAGGRAPQSAAVMASSVFNLARTEAIMGGEDMLVLVDITPDTDGCLRRMSVRDAGTNGTNRAPWTTFPSPAFFNQSLSSPLGTTNLTIGGKAGTYAFYKFKSNGQLNHPSGSAKFIVSPGSVDSGVFRETGTNKRYGFLVHRMGKLTFYDDPSAIQTP